MKFVFLGGDCFYFFSGKKMSLKRGSQWEQFSLPNGITGLSLSIFNKSALYALALNFNYLSNPKSFWLWFIIMFPLLFDYYFEPRAGKSFSSYL